jgi:hypothetical protein
MSVILHPTYSIVDANKISNNIYLGASSAAKDKDFLFNNNIKYILNVYTKNFERAILCKFTSISVYYVLKKTADGTYQPGQQGNFKWSEVLNFSYQPVEADNAYIEYNEYVKKNPKVNLK